MFTIHSFAVIVNGSQTSERMPTRRTCEYYSLQIEMFIEKIMFFGKIWKIRIFIQYYVSIKKFSLEKYNFIYIPNILFRMR